MGKTWTLQAIKNSMNPEEEALLIEDDLIYIMDIEKPHRLKMIFKKAGKRYVSIDLAKTLENVINKLAPHVDVKKLLMEIILLQSPPQEVLELKERLEKGYAKVTEAKLCYSLMIGGKRGKPYEFNLVG